MADEQIAAPSTAEAANSLDTFNEKERGEWLKNGTAQPKDEAEPAAASEPEKAEPIAPAADTGNKVQESRGERRKGQLSAEIADLLRQRAVEKAGLEADRAARSKPAEPATSAAPAKAEAAAAERRPDGEPIPPDPTKWTGTWEELEAAKIKYLEQKLDWKLGQPARDKAAADQAAAEAEGKQTFDAWVERRDAVIELDAEFADANEIVGRFFTARGVAPLIIESDIGPELVMHFYKLPVDEQQRVAKMSSAKLAREILRVEAELGLGHTPAADKPKETPQPKRTSAAAKPATELSGKNAGGVDDAEAALAAGDSAGYQRIMNARDLAKRRR